MIHSFSGWETSVSSLASSGEPQGRVLTPASFVIVGITAINPLMTHWSWTSMSGTIPIWVHSTQLWVAPFLKNTLALLCLLLRCLFPLSVFSAAYATPQSSTPNDKHTWVERVEEEVIPSFWSVILTEQTEQIMLLIWLRGRRGCLGVIKEVQL